VAALFVVGVLPDGGFMIEDLNPAHQASIEFRLADVAGKRIDEILPPDMADWCRPTTATCWFRAKCTSTGKASRSKVG
jgi:hypothetical protein